MSGFWHKWWSKQDHHHNGVYALYDHVHEGGPGSAAWGGITGILADQLDLQAELDGKSDIGHDHDGDYSLLGHHHDAAYAAIGHNHDADYSALGHDHDGDYAALDHNHDLAYASLGHDHDADYAALAHTHPAVDISDSTATGRSVLTAANAPAARTAIGAQTQSAVLDATTASFTTADETKLDGVAAGATVGATWGSNITGQPAVVSQADAEAGTSTAERIWTAQRVAQAIAALAEGAPGGGGITSVNMQVIAASGDYTPTAGMTHCIVILTGPGGGGGGADSSTTTNDIGAAGGGGAGATRIGLFDAAAIGASKAVVLGTVGAAGSATNGTNGGTGTDSTFGSTLLVAPGGLGGIGTGASADSGDANLGGAPSGSGSGGLFGVPGGAGMNGLAAVIDGTVGDGSYGMGGMGGASFWGGGGRGGSVFSTTIGVSATSAGTNGGAPGSGAGGAVCSDTTAGVAGGVGAAGICWIIEFIA